ncbi:MAG TPA: hypothetical protein VEQ61_07815 [Thermoleophilaceae bacterium]|nr:hypothetical protein [Thermoleophilaceae bacterium]
MSDEQELDHEKQADALEREGKDLEERSEQLEEHIDEARGTFEANKQDSSVPGLQPEDGGESTPGVETDPERVSEQGGP